MNGMSVHEHLSHGGGQAGQFTVFYFSSFCILVAPKYILKSPETKYMKWMNNHRKLMKFNLGRGCYFCFYKDENHPMGWI